MKNSIAAGMHQFGVAMDKPYDSVGATVRWLQKFCQAKFEKIAYHTALISFQTLCGETWI